MQENLLLKLPKKMLRTIFIIVLTLLLGSALLAPKLNPFTRDGVLAAENIGPVWSDINQWRLALSEMRNINDEWPSDIKKFEPQTITPYLAVTSPRPNILQINLIRYAQLGSLSGTQLILEFIPSNHSWKCRAGTPPMPAKFMPMNCEGATSDTATLSNLKTLPLVCALTFIAAGIFAVVRHPLLGPSQLRPDRLRRTPYRILPKLDRLLGLTGRRQATLQAAGISTAAWQRAVAYVNEGANKQQEYLATRLSVQSKASTGWSLPGQVFEWQFTSNLPVSLDRCLVFIPYVDVSDETLIGALISAQIGSDVMLILARSESETEHIALQAYCEDKANMFVMLDGASQTECMLSRQPAAVLLRLLAEQLRVTRISPYQTRGAVTSAGAFFGREKLLARVVGREPSNYLVVGGRQLGKSSLLKAVQRSLQGHPHVVCHYISLRDHRLAPRMALQFGLDATTSIEDIISHLEANFAGKRLFLLIDEADLFFRDESINNYPQLSALRSLSDEGRCWFMLAGFWDLYATAVLDYQSPLRNFGEVLTIGGLEQDACKELVTVPLSRLRFGFSSNQLVDQLVEASGQRANLLAILCQECLEALLPGERAIEVRHVTHALSSQAVQDALAGWGRLSNDEASCRLDRIVVYHTALKSKTSLSVLAALFADNGLAVEPETMRQALSRLQLAYVLKRDGADFVFAVPLLTKQFEQSELMLLLSQELSSMKTTDVV